MSINDRSLTLPDGTRIAYRVEGEGPALVLTNGLTTTTTFWKYVRPIWLQRHTVVTWDLPGHGRSGPAQSAETATIQAQPQCIASVMHAAGVERAFQIGWSTGSQVVLETYRQRPALCRGLIMLLGPAGHVLQTARLPLPGDLIAWLLRSTPQRAFAATAGLMSRGMQTASALRLGRWLGLIGARASTEDMQRVTQHIASVDPLTLQRMACSSAAHSAQDVLTTLRVPLLIVAGDRDPFAPSELVGVPLHRLAVSSELVRLPEGTHTALLEQPEVIATAVERFIERALAHATT
jgi:pimeloyl-ACP methyl ester carboxylesterase